MAGRRKLKALIDGDILIHRISAAVEVPTKWDDDIWTLHSDARMAKVLLDVEVAKIREKLGGKNVDVVMCVSHKENWRKAVYPAYKSNRKDNRKPLCYSELRAYVSTAYAVECWWSLEADDVMGIMATAPKSNAVIVTIDKDLKTIPARLFNPDTEEMWENSVEQADYAHMMQTLCGDQADGYPGCPGIGAKRAADILASTSDPVARWSAIKAAFEKAGLSEFEAIVQARIARILRSCDFNKTREEVLLWNPPQAMASL